MAALAALTMIACEEKVTTPPNNPPADAMTYKTGARYEFETYRTDAETNARTDTSARIKRLTLVNANASLYGRTGVAVYVDSVFTTLGGFLSISDSTIIQQQSGTNDIYRYASLAPELDFSGVAMFGIGLGNDWRHEAKLGASTAAWEVGQIADTFDIEDLPAGIEGIVVKLKDSAVASVVEDLTINGTAYKATKTTHRISLNFTVLTSLLPVNLPSAESLTRTTWTVPSLGVIAREDRPGKVLNLTVPGYSLPPIPVPGYFSVMTKVVATGN